jgi:MSHA biogenesis protein MshM
MQTLHHFGLKHFPLDKQQKNLWEREEHARFKERFNWLLESPGIGILTGEPGTGKTALLRDLTESLNPHRHQCFYLAETDFGRVDIYRSFALQLGLEPAYRRAQLWRDIKQRIEEMTAHHNLLPIWIIDEAQNLPQEFFKDFPSFLNFTFDSKDLMTVWLIGHPQLASLLDRQPYAALQSRIHTRLQLKPVIEQESFRQLIHHAFEHAGTTQTLISDSGMELLRQSSNGIPRRAGRLLTTAMNLAAIKGINHLPDEMIQEAIEEMRM